MRVRVASHVHSNWSYDGHYTLDDIAAAFARKRYRVVLMAEHDVGFSEERWRAYRDACAAASTDRLLLVPGIEYQDAGNVVHIATWGTALPFFGEARPTDETIRSVRELGGLSVLAHPARRGASELFATAGAELPDGFELWNRKYDGWAPGIASSRFDDAGLLPFVSLDFHTSRQFCPLSMTVELDAPVSCAAVLGKLAAGHSRPELFHLPAARFADGPGSQLARGAERVRRPVARTVRRTLANLAHHR